MSGAGNDTRPAPAAGRAWRRFRSWFVGLMVLSALIVLVTHFGELEHFAELLREAEPAWLALAIVLQVATYFCVAGVWHVALRHAGARQPLLSLVPLGVAKLFSDQAMPSVGMSGTAFFVAALSRRGIPAQACLGTLLASLVAYYGAYLVAAAACVTLLWLHHAIHPWIVVLAVLFAVIAAGIPSGALWLSSIGSRRLPDWLARIRGAEKLLAEFAAAPRDLLRKPKLIAMLAALHGGVFLLDAATLWVMLQVVGVDLSPAAAFSSFVIASMVATIGPIPLGLGTFEAACVTMLGLQGASLEASLAATLLLRGFTLWLPMLPGLWLARRALR